MIEAARTCTVYRGEGAAAPPTMDRSAGRCRSLQPNPRGNAARPIIAKRRTTSPIPLSVAQRMKLEHYGFIGDMHTAALVGNNGSIDWLCAPRFDSNACMAAL